MANLFTYEDWETEEELPLPIMTPQARAVRPLIDAADGDGPLQIIVADGNLADEHLDACEANENHGYAHWRELDESERQLIAALRSLPYPQREAAWRSVAYGQENW